MKHHHTIRPATRSATRHARRHLHQRGMNMLSMIVILIIGAIMTAAGIFGLKYVNDAKVNNELEELASLRGSTMLLASQRGSNFTGVTLSTITGLNFFPKARVSGSGATIEVTNQWKGLVTVAPATTISTNDSLAFSYTGVPSDACNALMTPAANIAVAISVGGTVVKSNGTTLQMATAKSQCDGAVDNATIVYTMSK